MFLTETWLKDKDNVTVNKLCPAACNIINAPRMSRGGGLAAVFAKQFTCRSVKIDNFNTFEALLLRIASANPLFISVVATGNQTIVIVKLYSYLFIAHVTKSLLDYSSHSF